MDFLEQGKLPQNLQGLFDVAEFEVEAVLATNTKIATTKTEIQAIKRVSGLFFFKFVFDLFLIIF